MAEGIGARAKAWWHARRQTDEQYVERIRKKQRSMRKARIVLLGLLAVVAIVILSNAARVICAIGKTVTDSEMDVLLFVFGLGIGVPLGFFVNSFFSFILLILFGERSDELMLKFYDELKSRELGVPGADGSGDQRVAGCNQ